MNVPIVTSLELQLIVAVAGFSLLLFVIVHSLLSFFFAHNLYHHSLHLYGVATCCNCCCCYHHHCYHHDHHHHYHITIIHNLLLIKIIATITLFQWRCIVGGNFETFEDDFGHSNKWVFVDGHFFPTNESSLMSNEHKFIIFYFTFCCISSAWLEDHRLPTLCECFRVWCWSPSEYQTWLIDMRFRREGENGRPPAEVDLFEFPSCLWPISYLPKCPTNPRGSDLMLFCSPVICRVKTLSSQVSLSCKLLITVGRVLIFFPAQRFAVFHNDLEMCSDWLKFYLSARKHRWIWRRAPESPKQVCHFGKEG